jgi:murein DD-endopeptidase MepM/ murein hydrolase activator NlpD
VNKFLLILFCPFLLKAELAFAESAFGLESFVYPILSPKLTSKFGQRKHPVFKHVKHHAGVDLAVPANSHVRAVSAGKVIYADKHGGYGRLVTVIHEDGYASMYGHLKKINVKVGDIVKPGQVIGLVGKTGTATGNHLHFEWRKDGIALDPLVVFPDLAAKAEG